MGEHAMLFIHRAWTSVAGANAVQLRALAQELEKIDEEIVAIVRQKAGVTEETVYQWLDGQADGTLFSAQEAVELGLADELVTASEGVQDYLRDYFRLVQRALRPVDYVPDDPPGGEGEGVEGTWERPRLEDFTDKTWDELTIDQRREIAKYFGFAKSLDTFGDLKLPHHFPPNHPKKGKASLAGVRNALARLPLTEGLSEADRERVRRHLRAHLPEPEDIYREILASALLAFASTVR
jgi:enoyl-CoA hydratase/carnithine racemase